eukprot:1183663-Prorocentrum_minimum.AAC.2
MESVPGPKAATEAPLQMLITNLDFDEHKGRIALGRITGGGASPSAASPAGKAPLSPLVYPPVPPSPAL